jgi:hypothetical protein
MHPNSKHNHFFDNHLIWYNHTNIGPKREGVEGSKGAYHILGSAEWRESRQSRRRARIGGRCGGKRGRESGGSGGRHCCFGCSDVISSLPSPAAKGGASCSQGIVEAGRPRHPSLSVWSLDFRSNSFTWLFIIYCIFLGLRNITHILNVQRVIIIVIHCSNEVGTKCKLKLHNAITKKTKHINYFDTHMYIWGKRVRFVPLRRFFEHVVGGTLLGRGRGGGVGPRATTFFLLVGPDVAGSGCWFGTSGGSL